MKRTTKRKFLAIVLILSMTQVVYIYVFGGKGNGKLAHFAACPISNGADI